MDNRVRVERMLRELHSGPPLRFLADVFSLTELALDRIVAAGEAVREAAGQDNDQAPA